MTGSFLPWYSLDKDLMLLQHECVGLERALEIVDEYLSRGAQKCGDANEAVSATMFGFSRSDSVFIELCANGPDSISYKFEMVDTDSLWIRRIFGGAFRFEAELQSRSEVVYRVRQFFENSPNEIKAEIQSAR